MSDPIRVAIVGCGAMGRRHARIAQALPEDLALVGVTDVDAEAAATTFDVVLGGLSAACAAAELVVVATPIETHVEVASEAIGRGRHVFVEKPLAATAEQAAALVDAARRAGVMLFVGHSERFNPVVRALVDGLDGAKPSHIDLARMGPARPGRALEPPILLNLGVHDLDLVAYLTGSPPTVVEAHGIEHDVDVRLAAGACTARVHVARTEELRRRQIEVHAGDAAWRGDLLERRLDHVAHGRSITREIPVDEPLVAQARALAAALRGEPSSIARGEDGLRAVEAAELAAARLRPRPPGLARSASAEKL